LSLLLTSFVYLLLACTSALVINYGEPAKTHLGVIYSRIFTAGTGLVARYHRRENAPKRPGVAVSNHLSPNDIQAIAADVDPSRPYLYTVTGQKHSGVIWAIERLVEKLCPSIWLERANAEERRRFTRNVLRWVWFPTRIRGVRTF
jgi:1-acyl-sn-glycerol-3-phosphate acyltransferase